jgi:cephalosporin hydroxylase
MGTTTTIRRGFDKARELASAAQALPGARDEFRRLNEENKRLRWELKRRPSRTEAPSTQMLAEDEAAAVRAFHLLFRDNETRRPYKSTYWRGHRVIKCPLDLWVYQEIIHEIQPDLLIETGTMYGGSAYFLASMMDFVGKGEVLTIDRNHREGRPEHPRVTYLTGSSSDPAIVAQAAERAQGKGTVMVVLDSNHKAFHVLDELRAYHSLVTPGSYLVVEDTNINGHPVEPDFGPGPMEALTEFLAENGDFEVDAAREKYMLTFNPGGWLRKKAAA